MKKIILSALVISMGLTINAQEIPERKTDRPAMQNKMNHKKRGGHDKQEMMKQLNLTVAQKQQFKTQREDFQQQMAELKKNDNITVKDWKAKKETLHKEQKAKMDAILTSDQKATLEKLKAEGKGKHDGMNRHQGNDMKTQLGLTDDQSAKMKKSREEMMQKMKALRDDKTLIDEQRMEKRKELMKQQKESMKSILTPEQMKKLNETKKQKPGMDGRKKTENKNII